MAALAKAHYGGNTESMFAEWGLNAPTATETDTTHVWACNWKVFTTLCEAVVYEYNTFAGGILQVNWLATDLLINRLKITLTTVEFKDLKHATDIYIKESRKWQKT